MIYDILKPAHSGLRWVVLILLLVSIVKSFTGDKNKLQQDRKIFSMTMASVHLQILIGIALYIISPLIEGFMASEDWMKTAIPRFFILEHMILMILSGLFVTLGFTKFKKKPEVDAKYRAIKIFFILALVIILLGIPWPFREIGAGRGWM